MGNRSLHEVLAAIQKPPRHARLLQIQEQIQSLRPDALECYEVLDSLGASLRLRYDNPSEALMALSLARNALERLDLGREVDARDEVDEMDLARAKRDRDL